MRFPQDYRKSSVVKNQNEREHLLTLSRLKSLRGIIILARNVGLVEERNYMSIILYHSVREEMTR